MRGWTETRVFVLCVCQRRPSYGGTYDAS